MCHKLILSIDRRNDTITVMLIIFSEEMETAIAQFFIHDEGIPMADIAHMFSRPVLAASYPSEARSQTTVRKKTTRSFLGLLGTRKGVSLPV